MGISRKQGILKRVRALLKGEPVNLPSQVSEQDLRNALNVPRNRMLVVRPAVGGPVRRVNPKEIIDVQPDDEFDDMPIGRWGD